VTTSTKLTQSVLDAMVERVVPHTYWPLNLLGKKVTDSNVPPMVTNISIQTQDDFLERMIKYYSVEQLLVAIPKAYRLNWGYLMKAAKAKEWEKHTKSCGIWLNEVVDGLTTMETEFILLHEVGHVDWDCRKEELSPFWSHAELELYADLYAHDQLAKIYDAPLAKQLLESHGSLHGYGSEESKFNA